MNGLEIIPDAAAVAEMMKQFEGQVPYATMVAINRTLDDAQDAQRRRIDLVFNIRTGRSRKLLHQSVLIRKEDRATKDRLKGFIRIDANREGSQFNLLPKFETGGIRLAHNLQFPFAIPTKALRPNMADSVNRRMYPANLGLVARRDPKGNMNLHARGKSRKAGVHTTSTGKVQLKGKMRTFVITQDPGSKQWGVFQRIGPGPGDIRLIWAYRERITIPAILGFGDTVRAEVLEVWDRNLATAMLNAIRTAR